MDASSVGIKNGGFIQMMRIDPTLPLPISIEMA